MAGVFITPSLLVFVLGMMAWFYARFRRKGTADFRIYRFTRHPQYLGWILWSSGLKLRVALRRDTLMRQGQPRRQPALDGLDADYRLHRPL